MAKPQIERWVIVVEMRRHRDYGKQISHHRTKSNKRPHTKTGLKQTRNANSSRRWFHGPLEHADSRLDHEGGWLDVVCLHLRATCPDFLSGSHQFPRPYHHCGLDCADVF